MSRSLRPRTMSIGGATFDLFVRTDRGLLQMDHEAKSLMLPIGAKIRVKEVLETCGGGASNTAVGLSRLGIDAGFCGVVGSDQWGEKLLKNLQKEGVDIGCATVVEGETSSSSIILSVSSGERTILYDPGTNAHLHAATFDKAEAMKRDWIYLNHLSDESCVIQNDIFDFFDSPDANLGLTWNPGGCQIDMGYKASQNAHLLMHTDILLLNKEEALAFTAAKTVTDATTELLQAGVRIVCITDGKNGTDAADGQNAYHCPAIEDASIIDTTGAGDAFGTGFTWAILTGLDLPSALKAGTINATSVLGTIGAQAGLLTDIEMQKKLHDSQLAVHTLQ